MLGKLREALASRNAQITPQQGKRLRKEEAANGDLNFTIKGQGRPGFFLIFGLMFGGFPLMVLTAMIFGTPSPDNGSSAGIFTTLFLIPFLAIGAGTFFTGLFLWFGKTKIEIRKQTVTIQRQLFGKTFQRKSFDRATLDLSFILSHTSNDVPSYKLSFNDEPTKNKIGIGGSLKEAELLWLEPEIRKALGQETEEYLSVTDAIAKENGDEIHHTIVDPNYRSKTLSFTKTHHGWEAHTKSSTPGTIVMILFGSVFLIAGLMMADTTRTALLDLLPSLRDAFSNGDLQSSNDSPPIWFALIFGGAGLFVMLGGLFQLGYRVRISQRHSRLHIQRRWSIISVNSIHDFKDITSLEIKKSGDANDVPRYRLRALLKNGQKARLLSFASAADVGQLHARLSDLISPQAD